MFGDLFAGSLLLIAGIVAMVTGMMGRHFLLLMGIFSIFCGLVYNDFTSVSIYLWDSCWELPTEGETIATLKPDCVYPVGIDPVWYMSQNEILFINSVKMKIALILGVIQMTLGIILKGCNDAYNKRVIDFCFEFIPQLVMFMCLFGFMDLMVIKKWLTDYTGRTYAAPAIINSMLNMAMNGGQPSDINQDPLFGTHEQQTTLMNILMLIVLVCVPLMLCVKPCYIQCTSSSKEGSKVQDEFEKVTDD